MLLSENKELVKKWQDAVSTDQWMTKGMWLQWQHNLLELKKELQANLIYWADNPVSGHEEIARNGVRQGLEDAIRIIEGKVK